MIKDSYSDFCDSNITSNQYKVDLNLIFFCKLYQYKRARSAFRKPVQFGELHYCDVNCNEYSLNLDHSRQK